MLHFVRYPKLWQFGVLWLYFTQISAQDPILFTNESQLISSLSNRNSLATAVADINGDFRDDIVQIDQNKAFLYHIQLDEGEFFSHLPQINPIGLNAYTLNVGDFDNSGTNDIMNSGFYNGVAIATSSMGLEIPIISKVSDVEIFSQGSNLIDINNDGWLDIFLTHDEGTNRVLINDRTGTYIEENWSSFLDEPFPTYGNYSAIWIDADNDDDQDLYVAKCVAGSDSDEFNRDELYINDGGRFTKKGEEFGIDYLSQSWAVDSGDLDNDGDMDIVVISHSDAHYILENVENDSFIRHGLYDGIDSITTPDLQVSIADLNNDGWQDIIIAGVDDYILNNRGNFDFQFITNPFGNKRAATFALGDLNEDGYLDAYVGYLNPKDEIWRNIGGSNHYVKFSLSGRESNRSGIGAKLELHGPWGVQTKWLNSGVAYGITNSLNINFGIANYESIDSVVCLWPSGMEDVYSDLSIDKHYVMTEGECMTELLKISSSDTVLDCQEDNVVLKIENQDTDWYWNTSIIDNEITVVTPGFFYAGSNSECRNMSQIIEVKSEEYINDSQLSILDSLILCEGSILPLSHGSADQLTWNNGQESNVITIDEAGTYYAYKDLDCLDSYTDSLTIEYVQFSLESIIDTIYNLINDTTLVVEGENITWFQDSLSNVVLSTSTEIDVTELSKDTTFYFIESTDLAFPIIEVGPNLDINIPYYGSRNMSYSQDFEVLFPLSIERVKIYSEFSGARNVLILSEEKDTVFSKEVELDTGYNSILLEFPTEIGTYSITTDRRLNIDTYNQVSPGFHIFQGYDSSQSELAGMISLLVDSGDLYYFFDWEIKPYFEPCRSEILTYDIFYNGTVSTTDPNKSLYKLYPNPVSNILNIDTEEMYNKIEVLDSYGRVCLVYSRNKRQLDLSLLVDGIYQIIFHSNNGMQSHKFIKI